MLLILRRDGATFTTFDGEMRVRLWWCYIVVVNRSPFSSSFPMLPWWRSCRKRNFPLVQQKVDLHPFASHLSISNDDNNADDVPLDRKRKAWQSLGHEDEQERNTPQSFLCRNSTASSDPFNDAQTPAKRICSETNTSDSSANTSNAATYSEYYVVTPLPETIKQQGVMSEREIQNLLWKEANYDSFGTDVALKRSDYLVWDDLFMGMAKLSAMRSKDPKAPFSGGACIADEENRVIGIGYNGFPRDCSDDVLPWWSDTNSNDSVDNTDSGRKWLHTQFPYVCHAEVNAILNKCSANVEGARLYVAQFPCHECAKVIIQSRIREVVYIDDKEHETDSSRASRIMFTMAGVTMRQYQPIRNHILLDFASAMALNNGNRNGLTEEQKLSSNALVHATDANATARFQELILNEAGYDPVDTPSGKRNVGVLSWDDWFMAVAFLTAKRSKDPNTQVGACIVDSNKRIVGLGYNGFPRGCSDDYLPWARTASSSQLHTKYLYVCHAEVNAILNKGSSDVKGATLYVALFPCNDCAKMMIQAGIREVVYLSDQYHETDSCRASRIMFTMAGVQLRQHIPVVPNITIDLYEQRSSAL